MNAPTYTFELKIGFAGDSRRAAATKEEVMAWLSGVGIDSFVEGAIDGLDIDHDYARPPEDDQFKELGGAHAPLQIYKYEKETLIDLMTKLQSTYGDAVTLELSSMPTEVWQEGWKASFAPIYTKHFVVYPPWEPPVQKAGLIPICIEPGMAFGTGQHATTVLCLQLLEENWRDLPADPKIADVGSGTGVLAIAAAKLGAAQVIATDIDQDAVKASQENAKRNDVVLEIRRGSVPNTDGTRGFNLVLANILAVVLKDLLPDISRALAPQGKLIMSGILAEQADVILRQAADLNLTHSETRHQSGWVGIVLAKTSQP